MGSRDYFENILKPLIDRLKADENDRSIVFAAAIVTYHAADWIAHEVGVRGHEVRLSIVGNYPDFSRIEAVANMHKHRETSRTNYLNLIDNLSEGAQAFVIDEYGRFVITENGEFVTAYKNPQYRFPDGSTRYPLPLFEGALGAIEIELGKRGL